MMNTFKKPKNKDQRPREYLTPKEMEKIIKAAKTLGRYRHRDATMILMAYRHGLRVSELVNLKWSQIQFDEASIYIRRLKKGTPSTHPIGGTELRALRKLKRKSSESPYLFVTERNTIMNPDTFNLIVKRAGDNAKIGFPIHAHMFRHAAGFKLANDDQPTRNIQHYLGHKNIQHTVRYTEIVPGRFKNFWND